MIILKLLSSLLIIHNSYGQCPLVPSQGPDPIPLIPNKFQTRVEINIENQNRMTEMRYFYDFEQRKAAILTRESNTDTKLIFNYDTDEIYELKNKIDILSDPLHWPPDGRPEFPTTCKTYKLSNTTQLNYYFGLTLSGGSILPGSAATIFGFSPITYVAGNETVRGIPCDVYKSCAKDPFTNSDYVITHYFSKKNFVLAGGDNTYNRLPVRAIFEKKLLVADAPEQIIKYNYDFHEFKLFVERPEIFQTPSSVYCLDRKATKQVPSIQQAFGFSQEITSNSQIQYVKNFYTFQNFSRYEIRNPIKEEATFYTLDPVIYISELSAGIQYGINQRHGNCSVRGIKNNAIYLPKFNQTFNSLLDFLAQIQSTQSFLSFDSEFIHTGQRISNGISSDRFITNKSSGVYEYTFSDESYTVFNYYESEKSVPLSLYIDNKKSELSSHSSFYNFETLPPSNLLRLFDIGTCFLENETIDFDIVFPYRGIVSPEDILKEKQLDVVMFGLLTDLTKETVIRFKTPTISVSTDGNLYVRSGIYPLPPPITFFTFFNRTIFYGSFISSSFNLKNVEECAEKCFNNEKCLSFDFGTSRSCYLFNRTIVNGSSSSSTYYDHYIRNVPERTVYSSNIELFNSINNLAVDGIITLSVSTKDENNQIQLKTLKSKEVIEVRNRFDRFGTSSLLSKYDLIHPNSKFTSFQPVEFSQITIDDCVAKCNDQVGFDCNMFEFCYQTGDCRLRQYTESENATDYSTDLNCDIYEKDALSHYNRFRSHVSVNKKDLTYVPVKNPSECARKCDKETKINCKSFNFCPLTSECYLSTHHLTDASSMISKNSTCDHFSRNFLSDFTYVATSEIKLIGEVVLSDANLERCSAYCVTSEGIRCKSFEYCESSKTCILNSGSSNLILNLNVPSDKCGHYRREYFYETNEFFNSKSKSDKGKTVLIVLSIIFSILSIVGGALGTVYFFDKKMAK